MFQRASRFLTLSAPCRSPRPATRHRPPDPRTQAPLVRAATVQAAGPKSRSFTGTVAARVQSDLGFRVSGKVLERLVDAGQTVKRGQPLMRIDPRRPEARRACAAGSVGRRRARGAAGRRTTKRAIATCVAPAPSQPRRTTRSRRRRMLRRAQLSAAEAQAEVARNANRYAELVADADGVVIETLAEPGQVVDAGQAVVRMAQAGRREAVVQLPETLRPAVGSTGQATLFGREGVAVPAKLRQLSDAADRLTRTFEARYVLEGELANAPLGATVTVDIPDGSTSAPGGCKCPSAPCSIAGKGPASGSSAGEPAKVRGGRCAVAAPG